MDLGVLGHVYLLEDMFDDVMQILDGDCSTVDMVYLDFSKGFIKVNHGILLLKLKALGITENLGVWFYNFLIHHSHFVRFPGGISVDVPVLRVVYLRTQCWGPCFS